MSPITHMNLAAPISTPRRNWLRSAGVLTAAALLPACAPLARREDPWNLRYPRPAHTAPSTFARPFIDPAAVTRIVVGLRPYRPAGFVVRAESFGDKTLVHNYGHGGAGITLSWGSAMLAADLAPAIADRRAAVIGAGVLGLSTARVLQQRGWNVTVYARELPPYTTSDIAGGQWAPTSVFSHDAATPAFMAQFGAALEASHHWFASLAGRGVGVSWRETYQLSGHPRRIDDSFYLRNYPALFPDTALLSPHEHPFDAPYVLRHSTLLIEPAIYLPWLIAVIRAAGGNIVSREFADATAMQALSEPVIFNCTGLGAAALFGDAELMPVRGQLVFLPPDPRLDYLTLGGGRGLLYMFPRQDGLLLGGSYEHGATHLAPDPAITARILAEHGRLFNPA